MFLAHDSASTATCFGHIPLALHQQKWPEQVVSPRLVTANFLFLNLLISNQYTLRFQEKKLD